MLSQVVINQGNFALQNRAENVVQTVVHCFSITSSNKLIINKIIPLSQSPLGSQKKSCIKFDTTLFHLNSLNLPHRSLRTISYTFATFNAETMIYHRKALGIL